MDDKIKSTLLKSGVPLEISTARVLQENDFEESGEIFYRRDEKIHSTDIFAYKEVKISETINFRIILSIECKHRNPDKKWIFYKFPDNQSVYQRSNSRDLFDEKLIELLGEKSSYFEKYNTVRSANPLDLEIVHKGTQLEKSDKFNHSAIRKAKNQAKFGAISKHIEWYSNSCQSVLYALEDDNENLTFNLSLPIVVTTAEILKFKELSLEEVRKSNPEELFEEAKFLALATQNKDEFLDFAENKFEKERKEYYSKLKSKYGLNPGHISYYGDWYPGFTYIVNFSNFEDFIDSLEEKLARLELSDIVSSLSNNSPIDNRNTDLNTNLEK